MSGGAQIPVSTEVIRETLASVERAELFDRKPNQGRLFRLLAQRLLAGETESVKEYVLGVDALGRPANFDPKMDSIVRVEVRKLRLTLEEHFQKGRGKDSPWIVRLPRGSYSLEVVPRDGTVASPAEEATPKRLRWLAMIAATTVLAGLAGATWLLLRSRQPDVAAVAVQPAGPPLSQVRILAGNLGEDFTDTAGRQWGRDRFYEGGIAASQKDSPVTNVDDPRLFHYHREGQFRYDIPLEPGLYELRLYFAEFLYGQGGSAGGGEVSRLFRIVINGAVREQALDVVASAPGRGVAMRKVFLNVTPASDGKLHLGFEMLRPDKAFVNAIEVVPGLKDRMLPLRMVCAPQPATDGNGNVWEPDAFVIGGRREPRSRAIAGAPAEALFRSERFGHFTYHLHVVPGHTYRLNLWMAEQYFGYPGASAKGYRIFDLYMPGVTLLRAFDPLEEAGGPGRAVRRSFAGLRPDAYGAIRLHFLPVFNYAMINALELLDEGPE